MNQPLRKKERWKWLLGEKEANRILRDAEMARYEHKTEMRKYKKCRRI